MKKAGKQSPGGSSSSSDPQGTSRDASEQMCPNPPSQEDTVRVTSLPHPKQPSYSMELFNPNPWQDLRWYQIPLSSSRRPKAGLFSFTFQSSLEEYQQLRRSKNLKIGRPFSMPPPSSAPLMLTDGSQEAPHKRVSNPWPNAKLEFGAWEGGVCSWIDSWGWRVLLPLLSVQIDICANKYYF